MPEYEDDGNKTSHSLDSELDGFDVPLLRSPGVKKALTVANENLCHSTVRRILLADSVTTIIWHITMPI